jgi:amidohydrolase
VEPYTYIEEFVEQEKENLVKMARAIYQNPELGDREFFACQTLCDYLETNGFQVTRSAAGLETAFWATFGRGEGGPHIAFCAEYDALPEIGHGCGHNLIGVASVTAAAALAAGADFTGHPFRVTVAGTPNEEGRGGKIDLIRAGLFDDVDLAMMFHPGCSTRVHVETLACRDYEFIFHGRNAHAACEPWEGRNALDGVILTFNGINALRQHLKDDVRIHGVITDGGQTSNIVPARAAAQFCIRSLDNRYLDQVVERVFNCARGAALATGTELEICESSYPYDAMINNPVLEDIFAAALPATGYREGSNCIEGMGSIDMGNVSRVVPSIHPVLAVADQFQASHTAEFARLCDTPRAYETMLAAGKAMAITAAAVLGDPALQERIQNAFCDAVS